MKLFMSSKYSLERALLVRTALTVFLKKRMCHSQFLRAMQLCLDPVHATASWGVMLRFALAYMCSAARRSSDLRNLTYASACMEEIRHTSEDEPWVGEAYQDDCWAYVPW